MLVSLGFIKMGVAPIRAKSLPHSRVISVSLKMPVISVGKATAY